jgi:hypothetical protein
MRESVLGHVSFQNRFENIIGFAETGQGQAALFSFSSFFHFIREKLKAED